MEELAAISFNIGDNGNDNNSFDRSSAADEAELEMFEAEMDSIPQSTKRQMYDHGEKFKKFASSTGIELSDVNDEKLNETLRAYYYQLKNAKNEAYSPASLVCIRAAIQRYINVVIGRQVNIVAKNSAFNSCNRMLNYKIREFISSGAEVKHYDAIEDGDMKKLRKYFDRRNGERLQDEVIFRMLYELGERGREHLYLMLQKSNILRKVDADGREYVSLPSVASKNRSADISSVNGAVDLKCARIYNLEVINIYLDVIPSSSDSFLPKPILSNQAEKYRFSVKTNRGLRFLQEFMKVLSKKAELSKVYTNHCIRVTRICDLESSGCALSEIMLITGHKQEISIRRYLHRRRDSSLYRSAEAVHTALKRGLESDNGVSKVEPEAAAVMDEVEEPKVKLTGVTSFDGPIHKKMCLDIDGERNRIIITFE